MLLVFLAPKGFQVCLVNPIRTSTMRKNNIRKTKTDKVDTFIIYKTLIIHPCRFVILYNIILVQLKNIEKFRIPLKGCFPLLKEVPLPNVSVSMHLTHLTHLLKLASHSHFK